MKAGPVSTQKLRRWCVYEKAGGDWTNRTLRGRVQWASWYEIQPVGCVKTIIGLNIAQARCSRAASALPGWKKLRRNRDVEDRELLLESHRV
jgi:hypothetical protein